MTQDKYDWWTRLYWGMGGCSGEKWEAFNSVFGGVRRADVSEERLNDLFMAAQEVLGEEVG